MDTSRFYWIENSIELYLTASFNDHKEFVFYKVEIIDNEILIEKSVDSPWFNGF